MTRSTLRPPALLTGLLLVGCAHFFAKPPSDVDYSMTRRSARGAYLVTMVPQVTPVPVRRLHSWTLHVETTTGSQVAEARITVWGGMPQHGHGLPTRPQVTRALGNGDHLVEGMKFNMGGWWEVKFAVAGSAGTDTVTFNLKL